MKKITDAPKDRKLFSLFPFCILVVLAILLYACADDDVAEYELDELSITDVSPLIARVGDTVVIRGTGFDALYPSRMQISFLDTVSLGGGNINIVNGTDITAPNELKVRVPAIPDNAPSFEGPIFVTVRNRTVASSQLFTFNPFAPDPIITLIDPASGIVNDEITISGDHFVDGEDLPTVFFGDVEAELLSADRQQIVVALPAEVAPGEVLVTVRRSGFVSAGVPFMVNEPPAAVRETYWITSENNIERGIIEESGVQIETLYGADGLTRRTGIALDTERNVILFGVNRPDGGCDVAKVPIDGSETLATVFGLDADINIGQSFEVHDVALDTQANVAYIAIGELGLDFNTFLPTTNTLIYRLDLDTEMFAVMATIPGTFPNGIKIDPLNQTFYLSTVTLDFLTGENNGFVYKGALDGSAPPEILFDNTDGLENASNIAVDPEGGALYVVNSFYVPDGTRSTILQGNLDGAGGLAPFIESEDLRTVSDLEIDTGNGFLFWIIQESNGAIKRAALDGSGTVENLFGGINNGLYFDLRIE